MSGFIHEIQFYIFFYSFIYFVYSLDKVRTARIVSSSRFDKFIFCAMGKCSENTAHVLRRNCYSVHSLLLNLDALATLSDAGHLSYFFSFLSTNYNLLAQPFIHNLSPSYQCFRFHPSSHSQGKGKTSVEEKE